MAFIYGKHIITATLEEEIFDQKFGEILNDYEASKHLCNTKILTKKQQQKIELNIGRLKEAIEEQKTNRKKWLTSISIFEIDWDSVIENVKNKLIVMKLDHLGKYDWQQIWLSYCEDYTNCQA